MLQIKPILAALKRHKAGTVLIALQIALTLAIVCNALFIIRQRTEHLSRPTGLVESDLLTVGNHWVGADDKATPSLTQTDLEALRRMPGVLDATAINSYPLRGGGWSTGLSTNPEARKEQSHTTLYFSDDHALATMGLKLVAGRNFRPDEIAWVDPKDFDTTPVVIVSKALADKLYPHGDALGKPVYQAGETKPSTIIGIVERLQVPWTGTWAGNFAENSTLIPRLLTGNFGSYLVRARPGELPRLTKTVPALLFKTNHMRVIPEERGVRTFAEVRDQAYKSDRGMAILMGIVCAVLLAITAAGIVGLTSFWVGQRRKQIGVRRALGATRHDILSYFLTENLLIGAGGVIVGAALAIGMNLWLVSHFEMERLSLLYVAAGVIALLLLGQGAVLAPAMKASRVPPVEATRSV
ncbi:MAG TPA: FtsX-like permease family protein [Frateuria sp.]|uniref:ABC transporter permease n=1 Tax=Frateuria sp. TaxID=2211372 RepID=UPI002D7E4444|nr:FtsX-like permease family protein [Frateuria sp.]HET6807347.1 FtsX-like permease family protein [Frateuria sp.]